MLTGLHHIAILASDRACAVAFYEALGFAVQACYPRPERQDEIIMMEQSGVTLELFISANNPPRVSGPEAYGLRHLALRTEDAPAIRQQLIAAGYDPEPLRTDAFDGKAMFFIKDPDGLPVEIHE